LGWKLNATGNRVQHKFRLGSDRTTAELREALLRRIWGVIEKEPETGQPLWDDTTLVIAVQVAGGAEAHTLKPSARSLGAPMLFEASQALEHYVRVNKSPSPRLISLLNKVSGEVELVTS